MDKEEFKALNNNTFSRKQFVETFKNYELKYRFFGGQWKGVDKAKIARMKTLEVLAQGIYYKFYSDTKRKISSNDIVDILIMTTAPYCHSYISENNCIDIYKKIVRMNKCGISSEYMSISDLRK